MLRCRVKMRRPLPDLSVPMYRVINHLRTPSRSHSPYHTLLTSIRRQCCDRACPAPSAHQCPQSVGGGCCSVNSVCLFGNSCSKTINPATVNTVTPSPTGCTSNQFSCPASVGGGCCISGQTCTAVGTQLLCVANGGSTTARPTTGGGGALDTRTGSALSNAGGLLPTAPTSPSPAATPKSGLSSGAKAGIGVGIPLAVLSTLILLFFLIRRRRLRRQHLKNKAHSPPIRSTTAVNHSSASTPGTHPQGPSSTDYIGALPQPGPFTSTAQAMGMHDASNRGAVPLSPQSPGDITTPVEMAESQATSPASPPAGVGGTPRSGGGRGGDYFAGQVPRSSPAPVASPIQGQLPGQVPLVRELRALERPVELQDTSVKKS